MIDLGFVDAETVGGGGGKGKVPGASAAADDGKEKFLPSFGQAVSALRVVGSFLNDSIEYAAKVKLASLRSGQSVESIQRLTNAAVTQGISFDDVTTTLTEGNRRLGQGLVNGGQVQLGLNRLGVSMEQIRNKSVSASEVLMKMADLYKQTGDDVQMANLGVSVFGNSFTSLIPMLKQGREAIKALGDGAGILSKSDIEDAAQAKVEIERTKKSLQQGGVVVTGFFANWFDTIKKDLAFSAVGAFSGLEGKSDVMAARAYYGRFSGEGETIRDFAISERNKLTDQMNIDLNNPGVYGDSGRKIVLEANEDRMRVVNGLVELANRDAKNKTNMPGFQAGQMAWATSLQAMGGGDVLSAMAQNPQQQIADNTAQAVEILQNIDLNTGMLIPTASPTLEPSVTGPATP